MTTTTIPKHISDNLSNLTFDTLGRLYGAYNARIFEHPAGSIARNRAAAARDRVLREAERRGATIRRASDSSTSTGADYLCGYPSDFVPCDR